MLTVFLIVVLLVLSYIDTCLTLKIRKKLGPEAEENLILRELLRGKVHDFIVFKFIDGLLLGIVFTLLSLKNERMAISVVSLCLLVYIYVVYNNLKVWKNVRQIS